MASKGIKALIKANQGIKLDIGCGSNKQPGFVGMDIVPGKNVDIVHDAEVVPYPLPNECCNSILLSHLVEHMCPKKIIPVMNELWRISKVGGQLMLSTPYAGSAGYWQDPTHCHGWNEATVYYFDPFPCTFPHGGINTLYAIYRPKPWKIAWCNYYPNGNIEMLLQKRSEDEVKDYNFSFQHKANANI